jgi:LacI family transcriptional regulator
VLEARGYGLLLHTVNRGPESMEHFARHVSANAFDGLLLVVPPDALPYVTSLHDNGLPVVMIDDRGHHPGFPSVATDNATGGATAATHLLSLGRKRLAMVTGPTEFGCTRDRSAGFLSVAEAVSVEGDFTRSSGQAAVGELLAGGVAFDGVFAHNDLMAVGVLDGLRAAGLAVPDDVAVVGFDDISIAAHTQPALTTVRQPSQEMGEAAATMLLASLSGEPMPAEPLVLPTHLVVRESAPNE